MRVIAGTAGGRILKTIKGRDTRPTGDRVKEALFSIISAFIPGSTVLDLFAGTGNLAIEALSRGAREAVFVDQGAVQVRTIRENLELTGFLDKAEIYRQDALKALDLLARNGKQFDLIFLDPPYHQGLIPPVLTKIAENNLYRNNTLIVAETAKDEEIEPIPLPFCTVRQKTYGDTKLHFLRIASEEE